MSTVDFWGEIWEGMKSKPSRTLLTGLGVSWGIFILVLLLGIGSSFERGVLSLFEGYSQSTTYVYTSNTSKEYDGIKKGRLVKLNAEDLERLRANVPEIALLSPEISSGEEITTHAETGHFEVKGVNPDYFGIRLLDIEKGRLLNNLDSENRRRNVIIGSNVAKVLFNHSNPIGQQMTIKDVPYTVVGVIKTSLMNTFDERMIYMPYTTYTENVASATEFSCLLYATHDGIDAKKTNTYVRSVLSRMKHVAPDDDKAFYFNSMEEQVEAFNELFSGLNKFLWFMGISTLFSGVIGIGNIMYTTAKERTREIGIRKALGAKSTVIKSMLICESIALTSLAGLTGILVGWLCLSGIGLLITDDTIMMKKPGIDFPVIIGAMLVLVISGTIAGLKPALYAAGLNPIDALKDEN